MQRAGQQVFHAARTYALLPHQIASTSQVQWNSKRGIKTPLQWVRERITPQHRHATPKEVQEAAQQKDAEKGVGSIFDDVPKLIEQKDDKDLVMPSKVRVEHTKYSTAFFKISRRKLNLLANQIAGKPIDHAILQMEFSNKRAAKRIKSGLVMARKNAVEFNGLDRSKLVVAESWVNKGPRLIKRLEPKGRGKFGVREHPHSRLSLVLREGKTMEEKAIELRAKRLNKIRSPGLVREDRPLINIPPTYAW